jgi:hypothetical protein
MQEKLQRTRFGFLIADARIGLTFCRIALIASNNIEMRERNTFNALRAYDGILRSQADLILTKSQEATLNQLTEKLHARLMRLGEMLWKS